MTNGHPHYPQATSAALQQFKQAALAYTVLAHHTRHEGGRGESAEGDGGGGIGAQVVQSRLFFSGIGRVQNARITCGKRPINTAKICPTSARGRSVVWGCSIRASRACGIF